MNVSLPRRLIVPVLLGPLLLSGCGGAKDNGAKAAYLKRAEAICTTANTEQKALKAPTAVGELAPYVAKVVAVADRAYTALDALDPPAGDKAELGTKVLGPLKAQVDRGHLYAAEVAAAAKKKDQAELLRLLGNP
ncbi:MAG: hypothetical protein JWM40_1885, partial [Frankiales bacterium]|nr:hypothetical protein [Frankiales bacterium]